MKKILIIHNKYLNLGGEDIVVLNESKLLKEKYDVKTLYFKNDSKLKFSDIFSFLTGFNASSYRLINEAINEFNPDILYFHNIWFKINTFTTKLFLKGDYEVWLKQHNLRHECIQGMHYRKNSLCNLCSAKNKLPGLLKKCYHDSIFRSFIMTLFSIRYLNLLKDKRLKIITFSNFHIKRLVDNKIDRNKIFIVNNYVLDNKNEDYLNKLPKNYICFIGRASKEKGTDTIIDAFLESNLNNYKLLIVGKVNDDIEISKFELNENLIFLNEVKNNHIGHILSNSKALIMGSIAYEGHPVIISEAIKNNTLIVLPKFSGLEELLPSKYEYFYQHNNVQSLTETLNTLDDENKYQKNKNLINLIKESKYTINNFFKQIESLINE